MVIQWLHQPMQGHPLVGYMYICRCIKGLIWTPPPAPQTPCVQTAPSGSSMTEPQAQTPGTTGPYIQHLVPMVASPPAQPCPTDRNRYIYTYSALGGGPRGILLINEL